MKSHFDQSRGGRPSPGGRQQDIQKRREQSRAAIHSQLALAKESLLATRASAIPEKIERPGIRGSRCINYASTTNPTEWISLDAGRPFVEGVLNCIEDGIDRILMSWPHRPSSGFVIGALALREARASGRLAHATLAYWPWRSGATWAARQILVNPVDLADVAKQAINEITAGADWPVAPLRHDSLCMIEMRLRDLRSNDAGRRVVVRSPTLLETTCVFPPNGDKRAVPYGADPGQILRRVREHTHMGDLNAGLEKHLEAVADPTGAPFALFGLPPAKTSDALARFVTWGGASRNGWDAIVADLTRTGRSDLQDEWEAPFDALVKSLDADQGRRPPLVVITDDAFVLRRATRLANAHLATTRPRRKLREHGVYLEKDGLLGPAAAIPPDLSSISFEADIKDASLAPIRSRLLDLGAGFRRDGDVFAANAVSQVLRFVRRAASLPLGLDEAQKVAEILFDPEDDFDGAIRGMFRPKVALGRLASLRDLSPGFGTQTDDLLNTILLKCENWGADSPVSAKLATMFGQAQWNDRTTMVSIADRVVADVYMASDRVMKCKATIVDHASLSARIAADRPHRLIVLGPTPETVRSLLVAPHAPARVVLLGDVAGASLLNTEVAPLERLPEFSGFAARARSFSQSLRKGGADEALDISELHFRIQTKAPEGEINLTRADDVYRGDVVKVVTAKGHKLVYRPASDVLVYKQSELRPFERVPARNLEAGDEILVLDENVREPVRRAMAGSRRSLKELNAYHGHIAEIRRQTPGASEAEKARYILRSMQAISGGIGSHETPNIRRWLTADQAQGREDGTKQPRAAQDKERFGVFMKAVGVQTQLAEIYWDYAILPTRSFRAQEGHAFNQRVVQFVLDPEGTAGVSGAWKSMESLWHLVMESVDTVERATLESGDRDA